MSARHPSLRILLLDDEEEILELVGEYLRGRGHEVLAAADGLEGLELLRVESLDLVVSDVRMPQLDGLELLAEARRLAVSLPILLTSGRATEEMVLAAWRGGAADLLVKPFKLRDLHEALMAAWERGQRARAEAERAERLRYYEAALQSSGEAGLAALAVALAGAAQRGCTAAEAAVWLRGSGGWGAAARVGRVQLLQEIDPEPILAPLRAGEVLALPLRASGQIFGVLAVAGGAAREQAHEELLERLCRAMEDSLTR